MLSAVLHVTVVPGRPIKSKASSEGQPDLPARQQQLSWAPWIAHRVDGISVQGFLAFISNQPHPACTGAERCAIPCRLSSRLLREAFSAAEPDSPRLSLAPELLELHQVPCHPP